SDLGRSTSPSSTEALCPGSRSSASSSSVTGPSTFASSRSAGSTGTPQLVSRSAIHAGVRLIATRSALDAPARQLERIEEPLQLLGRQLGALGRDVPDRSALGVRLLRDRGALLVADHGIQRRDEDRIAL